MTTTNLDFLDPYCSLSHFYFMVYKHPLRETCSIKSVSFSRMTKARTCQKSQGNEKWYDLVINAGPEMESYFHKILACSYSRILPNNFTLLPKLDCSNGFILIQKMNGKYFFCPECGEYATMQNLREDSYEASVEETYCLHSKAAKILEIKDDKRSATELNGKKEQVFLVQNEPFPVYIVYPQENKKDAKGSKVALVLLSERQKCQSTGVNHVKDEMDVYIYQYTGRLNMKSICSRAWTVLEFLPRKKTIRRQI